MKVENTNKNLSFQFCTFGSRQIGRGYYVFDKRWNHIRCALDFMLEKHLNSQMWKWVEAKEFLFFLVFVEIHEACGSS